MHSNNILELSEYFMRLAGLTLCIVMACLAAGCGGNADSIPTSVNQDDQQKMEAAQQKANEEESAQRKNAK